MLALALGVIALPPASAQQTDIAASQKRFNDLYAKGNYPAALLEAQKLESLVKAQLGVTGADYAMALVDLANVHWKQGSYSEAKGLYERALTIREQALGQSHPFVGLTLNSLANVYWKEGRHSEAEELYRRSLAPSKPPAPPTMAMWSWFSTTWRLCLGSKVAPTRRRATKSAQHAPRRAATKQLPRAPR